MFPSDLIDHYSQVQILHLGSETDFAYAQDYFFLRSDFPWENVPDFVVGRPNYDNWMVTIE